VGFIELISSISDVMVFWNLPNAQYKAWNYVDYVTNIATSNANAMSYRGQKIALSFPMRMGLGKSKKREL
jgi:hypothetical protein